MLTEDQLTALVDALPISTRLILVGDPRQLPPIGAGRPFVDLILHLRTRSCRQRRGRTHCQAAPCLGHRDRHDTARSRMRRCATRRSFFRSRPASWRGRGAGRHPRGNEDERLRFTPWKTPSDLRSALDATLLDELKLDKDAGEKSLAIALGGNPQGDHVYFKEGAGSSNVISGKSSHHIAIIRADRPI